jgi:hypothetical protein
MNLTRTLRRRALPAPHDTAADPVPGPPDVEVAVRHLRIGDDYAATLAVTGYPAEVAPGWLEPLLSYPGRLDVALHIDPVPPAAAADRLRRQRARLESGRRAGADRGQLDDPDTEAAAGDARDLAYRLARGEGKLFRLGLYLTVHAASQDDLAEEVAAVRAVASSLLLVTAPATFRSLQGWVTTLPAGTDALKLTRTMDTAALAAAFPFTSPDLPRDPADPDPLPGILYGANPAGPGGRRTTTTPSPSPPPARGSPTWPSSKCSATPTRAPSAGSSTPKTNTPASPPAPAAPTCTSAPTACGSTPSTSRRPRPAPGHARTR